MKKQYIKMNNNDEHLSLGNLFRIIKDSSRSKVSALQSELFCTLFELESINEELSKIKSQMKVFEDRKKYYDKYQEIIYEQRPMIYIYSPVIIMAIRDKDANGILLI